VLVEAEPYLISQFRQRAGQHLSANEIEMTRTIWGTLVLMQHYRAPTRLLDWTLSPWVAAYFAAESGPTEDGHVLLFRLQALMEKAGDVVPETIGGRKDIEIPWPSYRPMLDETSLVGWQDLWNGHREWLTALQPGRSTGRMAAQQSLFTLGSPISLDHREWLSEHLSPDDKKVLVVPHRLKEDIMKAFEKMNLTAASLFPDLGGTGWSIRQMHANRIPMTGKADDWNPAQDA
jgi:hypothetical protein